MLLRGAVGGERVDAAGPPLKLTNAVAMLVLCYANAAVGLPQAVAYPDLDYLVLTPVVTARMCAAGFAAVFLGREPAGPPWSGTRQLWRSSRFTRWE